MTDIWAETPKVVFYRVGPEEQPTQPAYPSYLMTPWLEKVKGLQDIYAKAYKNMTEHAVEQADKLEAVKTWMKENFDIEYQLTEEDEYSLAVTNTAMLEIWKILEGEGVQSSTQSTNLEESE